MQMEMHLQENTLFDLEIKVTRNVAEYPLHHLIYASAKFLVQLYFSILDEPTQELVSRGDVVSCHNVFYLFIYLLNPKDVFLIL